MIEGEGMQEEFYYNVYAIVEEIPKGKVATYKLIAQLSNHSKNCRLVGTALRCASMYGEFPCHRVVHSDGSLVAGWEEQRMLLEQEGIVFTSHGKVNLSTCLWKIKGAV